MAKRPKLIQADFEQLESRVAAEIEKSPARKEALFALEALQPALDRLKTARVKLLRALGEEKLTEQQRRKLLSTARGKLGAVEGLLKRV